MLSLEQIEAEAREAVKRAAKKNLTPFIVEKEDLDNMPPFPFPFLGDYVPKGWKQTKEYFVDSSGFGKEGEPALSVSQFTDRLIVGRGYAITQMGQFQVYVGEYTKED